MRFTKLAVLAAITAPGAAFVIPNQLATFRRARTMLMAGESEAVQAGLQAAPLFIAPSAAFAAGRQRVKLQEDVVATENELEAIKKRIKSVDFQINVSGLHLFKITECYLSAYYHFLTLFSSLENK